MPQRTKESEHSVAGDPVGDFANFVSACRVDRLAGELSPTFRDVKYVNRSDDRRLPLYSCKVRDADVRGMYLLQDFRNSEFANVDFSHGAGYSLWVDTTFRACNLRSFRAQVTAVGVTFYRCQFGSAYIEHALFQNCHFVKCAMAGVWSASSFVNCSFEDVDLAGSIWRDPGTMQIVGSWRNEDQAQGFRACV